jgi:TrmH family RNA methyltransferase
MITSKHNKQIKLLRRLQLRKVRTQTGLFVVEGIHPVITALDYPDQVETVVVCWSMLTSDTARAAVCEARRKHGVQVLETAEDVFKSVSRRDHPYGLAAVVRQSWQRLEHVEVRPLGLWVALNAVQYPGNLGTILRTCDAVGVSGVILLDSATDPYHPTSIRASLSGIFTQKLFRADFDTFARWKQQTGCRLVGASGDASTHYRHADYDLPMVLLMGSEGEGLSTTHRALCDEIVSIPMRGRNDSLNIAVATGVILYEVLARHSLAAAQQK